MSQPVAAPKFDTGLIARYDRPGPRYTSYPAAPHFHAGFGEDALRAAIAGSNGDPIPSALSLYVHVPFCFSPCFYCACNRVITRDIGKADTYLSYLDREIAAVAPLFDHDRVVRQLHFGGGTPNFLDLPRMQALLSGLRKRFRFSHGAEREYGIEVDPRHADAAYVRGLAEAGFNRLSLGIQDFDPQVQQAVNRVQDVERVREIIETARDTGFASVSVDLIYGLPRQSVESFTRTLDAVLELAPDRIAAYSYAHLPERFKAQRQLDAALLPDAATKLALFGRTLEKLIAAGYVYIGMDHFAREEDELARAQREGTLQRNFQGYSTHRDCDIVGLGMSAISRIGFTYSQNAADLKSYYALLDRRRLAVVRGLELDADDVLRRALIDTLMCHARVDKYDFGHRHHIAFDSYFAEDLARLSVLEQDGLVEHGPQDIRVTPRGRLLIRHVAMCFDRYLHHAPGTHRYSRAI